MKLSRKQTREALQSVPLDAVLLGAQGAKQTKLTPREKRFAESLAMGKSKAQAYRDAVPGSRAKPETQSRRGVDLARKGSVQAQVEALQLAAEAQRHATPAALRALVIQQLTEHAINPDIQPAQRLRALELLGKVTEVAAFTERREIIKATDPAQARAALLEGLRSALRSGATDAVQLEPAPILAPVGQDLNRTRGDASQGDAGLEGQGADGQGADSVTMLRAAEPAAAPGNAAAYVCQDGDAPGSPSPAASRSGDAPPAGTPAPRDRPRPAAPALLSIPDIRSPVFNDPPLTSPDEQG